MSKKLLLAKELYKPVRKRFEKRPIITKEIDDLWAADLIDMKKIFKRKQRIRVYPKCYRHFFKICLDNPNQK